jgi:hypothetical protein
MARQQRRSPPPAERQLTSALDAWLTQLAGEAAALVGGDPPTENSLGTAESPCANGAEALYLAALEEATRLLPELRPAVVEAWEARYFLHRAAREGADLTEPGRRLLQALHALAAQLPVVETPALLKPREGKTAVEPGNGDDDLLPPEWDRTAWEELQPLPRRLLKHMLGRESDAISNVAEAVWGTGRVRDRTINTAVCRANDFLQKQGYSRVLTKPRYEGVVRWE